MPEQEPQASIRIDELVAQEIAELTCKAVAVAAAGVSLVLLRRAVKERSFWPVLPAAASALVGATSYEIGALIEERVAEQAPSIIAKP